MDQLQHGIGQRKAACQGKDQHPVKIFKPGPAMLAHFQIKGMALFKVNKANLALARATVRTYGQAFLHGCGNVYATEEDSNFRRDFSNPQSDKSESPSTYRLHFTDVSQVPTTVEDTERQFFASKQRDQRE